MKILILGCTGQIGWELMRSLQFMGPVTGLSRPAIDFAEPKSLLKALRSVQPDVVVNAAAYTSVENAEIDVEAATAVNAQAVGVLAEECRRMNALLVHYSTDFVFAGDESLAYSEDAPTEPLNVYGRTKLIGDQLLVQSGCSYLNLRVCWVYSLRRTNFLLSIVSRAQAGLDLRVVDDQIGSPTPAWILADATAHILQRRCSHDALRDFSGLVNVACEGTTSWHGFSVALLAALSRPNIRDPRLCVRGLPVVQPISSAESPARAQRPRRACLDLTRLQQVWGLRPPPWQLALDLTLRDV